MLILETPQIISEYFLIFFLHNKKKLLIFVIFFIKSNCNNCSAVLYVVYQSIFVNNIINSLI